MEAPVDERPGRAPATSAGSTVEGQVDALGGHPLLADLDVEDRTRFGIARSDVGHRDRLAERRRRAPARHDAGPAVAGVDGIAVPGDAPASQLETDEALGGPVGSDRLECIAADEVA